MGGKSSWEKVNHQVRIGTFEGIASLLTRSAVFLIYRVRCGRLLFLIMDLRCPRPVVFRGEAI